MALFSLSEEWMIELGADFEWHVEEGSLVFSLGDRAVWIDLFDDNRTLEATLELLRGEMPSDARSWEFEQEGLQKFGYLERDEENENLQLTTLCYSTTAHALIIFYFDEQTALDWALERWNSVQFDDSE